jgi:deoxycytidylate deaminase
MPCSTCCGLLIQSGIKRVVSISSDRPNWKASFDISAGMLKEAGIPLMLYDQIPELQ